MNPFRSVALAVSIGVVVASPAAASEPARPEAKKTINLKRAQIPIGPGEKITIQAAFSGIHAQRLGIFVAPKQVKDYAKPFGFAEKTETFTYVNSGVAPQTLYLEVDVQQTRGGEWVRQPWVGSQLAVSDKQAAEGTSGLGTVNYTDNYGITPVDGLSFVNVCVGWKIERVK